MQEVVATELEVRWGECDPAGIVYHPAYIDWFSVARMHWLKANGIKYMEAFHDNGIVLVVLGVESKFKKTLRAEDYVRVEARRVRLTKTRIEMAYQVFNEAGELCTVGKTEHAYVDSRNRAVNIGKAAPALWELMSPFAKD